MTVTKVIYWSFFLLAKLCAALHDGRELAEDYSNEWVVHLDGSNSSFDPDFLAAELGYQNLGEVIEIEIIKSIIQFFSATKVDYYRFQDLKITI